MEGDVKQQIGLNPFKSVGIQTHIITVELNLEHGTVWSLRTSWSKTKLRVDVHKSSIFHVVFTFA